MRLVRRAIVFDEVVLLVGERSFAVDVGTPIPFAVGEFPSMKVRAMLRLLTGDRLGYSIARQKGSHWILYSAKGYGRVLLSDHDGGEMGGNRVRKVLCDQVGLELEEALELVKGR
jgi:predicted RNA binding protein YcfA (HicA-like mRNA interferase family)